MPRQVDCDVLFCTVVTSSYAGLAQTLHSSLVKSNPKSRLLVLVVDADSAVTIEVRDDSLHYLSVNEVLSESQNDLRMLDYYDLFEQCNALRPFLIKHMIITYNCENVIYLDSDTWVAGSFDPIVNGLLHYSFGYSPHIGMPLPNDGLRPSEWAFTQFGIYNSGFLAFRKTPVSLEVLDYLCQRMRNFAFFDPPVMHGGQEILDLAACIFRQHFWHIDHPGANIAYWNLGERSLTINGDKILANGKEVIFFHLSGYDFTQGEKFTRFQGRHDFVTQPILKHICGMFRERLLEFTSGLLPRRDVGGSEPTQKARRRYLFLNQEATGFSIEKHLDLADPIKFNEYLLRSKHWNKVGN